MAWTSPNTWSETMVTASLLNTHVRDNCNHLSTHNHDGSAGNGGNTLSMAIVIASQANATFVDGGAVPDSTGAFKRNGNTLYYYNGTAVVSMVGDDATYASRRSIGTGANQASAGNHTHS